MILSALAKFIFPYSQFLVGFSGGLDSTVLLHRLILLRDQYRNLNLRAIHVHHGISPHANEWVIHCQSLCSKWNIPLIVKYVTMHDDKLGIECQARKVRYAAFASELIPGEVLVTAQHLEDQCETLLLALKRGSGPAGLSAMPARSSFAGTQKLRPLLSASRTSLEDWANKYDLHWIEDESNRNIIYDRNFLRLRVLPLLFERWPSFAHTTARSSQLCAEQESLLDELLAEELAAAISEDGAMSIKALKNKSSAHRAALLRRWIATHYTVMPRRDMIIRIWHEVALARQDANPILYLNGFEIRRYREFLWWVPCLPAIEDLVLYWPILTEHLKLPYNMGAVLLQPGGNIRLPTKDEQVTVRFKTHGMLNVVGRNKRRKIKKVWQEYKIPPWRRKTTPLLFYNEKLIAAAGVFVTKDGFTESGLQLICKMYI